MAAISHGHLAGATKRATLSRSRKNVARRGAFSVRAVQSPAKPSEKTPVKSTPIDQFPKSAVASRQVVKPASEDFKQAYSDYSTGYASVPGLS